ncbi:MBL fold metallo-hydrolase [Bacillus sp. SCS-153A]|uniref:MBL fold metallo-hydrolase n=1 Tax=Rossellomorea sedimentorum TaxID=3115294 RepID=UPI0039057758
MKLIKLNENTYYFSAAVNIGYILKDGTGLLIDTGIDDTSIKKVLKVLDQENLPLDYCIVTHAHTDHFGGASYLKKKRGVKLLAPQMEKALMENPILEPVYLWNGAYPLKELRNKFLEGKPVEIDEVIPAGVQDIGPLHVEILDLPGHSIGQAGVLYDDVLFAADAYFGQEALNKHTIPFIIDAEKTIETLEKVKELPIAGAVPGHGDFEENLIETLQANIRVHLNLMKQITGIVETHSGMVSFDDLLKKFLDENRIQSSSLGQFLLYRTSFTAYITKLINDGFLKVKVEGNKIYISV